MLLGKLRFGLVVGWRDKFLELSFEEFDVFFEDGDLPLKILALTTFVAVDSKDLIVFLFPG